nr:MAG: nonstructural protein [Army ant associated chapparvovirus 1]
MEVPNRHSSSEGEGSSSMGLSSSTSAETHNRRTVIRSTNKQAESEENSEHTDELGRYRTSGPARGAISGRDDISTRLALRHEYLIYASTREFFKDWVITWQRNTRYDDHFVYGDKCRELSKHEYMTEWVALIIKLRNYNNPDPEQITDYFKLLEIFWFGGQPALFSFELNDKNVPHCHVIIKTTRRADKVREHVLNHLGESQIDCIRATKVKNFQGMLKYMLKKPIAIGSTEEWLLDLSLYYANIDKWEQRETTNDMNIICKDIIEAMNTHKTYTSEGLYAKCPEVMGRYLHKTSLESIVTNCRNWIKRPSGLKRVLLEATNANLKQPNKIHNYLKFQNIHPLKFDEAFISVMINRVIKKNVICLYGISDSGKSTFIRGLCELFSVGQVVNGGNFQFSDCAGKEIILWEEPLITSEISETCKLIFEGYPTTVAIKWKDPKTLTRTPVLITTNRRIWHYCSHNKDPLQNRIYEFDFTSSAHNLDDFCNNSIDQYRKYIAEYFKSTTDRSLDFRAICSGLKWCTCTGCFSSVERLG